MGHDIALMRFPEYSMVYVQVFLCRSISHSVMKLCMPSYKRTSFWLWLYI